MSYRTTDLQDAIDKVLVAYVQSNADASRQHFEQHREAWANLRDLINLRARQKRPITERDFRAATGHRDSFGMTFSSPRTIAAWYNRNSRARVRVTVDDFRSLYSALEATTKETITDRDLANMGYPGTVSMIFNALNDVETGVAGR